MTTAEFWDQQQFSYLVTYSFNRGPKLAALREASKVLFRQTRQELLTASLEQLPEIRNELRNLEQNNGLEMMALTTDANAFQITATPIATIKAGALETAAFADLLKTPIINQFHWMCWPTYRDALAFYSAQDELISVLNICFGCDNMLTDTGEAVQADVTTYKALLKLLKQLSHPIETVSE